MQPKMCGGDGGMKPCEEKNVALTEVKSSAAPGWRGYFCERCLYAWIADHKIVAHFKTTITPIAR